MDPIRPTAAATKPAAATRAATPPADSSATTPVKHPTSSTTPTSNATRGARELPIPGQGPDGKIRATAVNAWIESMSTSRRQELSRFFEAVGKRHDEDLKRFYGVMSSGDEATKARTLKYLTGASKADEAKKAANPTPPSKFEAILREQFTKGEIAPVRADGTLDPRVLHSILASAGANKMPAEMEDLLGKVPFRIVDDASISGDADAFYDQSDHEVKFPYSMLNDLVAAAKAPTSETTAATTELHRTLATRIALLVHEAGHAAQDRSGEADKQIQIIHETAASPYDELRQYVGRIELPAQRLQEQAQAWLQVAPRVVGWLTLDTSGKALSDDAATDRMMAEHGAEIERFREEANGNPGFKFPGFKFPGFKFPGFKFPGFKFPGQLSS